MSTSTAESKPVGIQKEKYMEAQRLKAEEDFKYSTSQELQTLRVKMAGLQEDITRLEGEKGSDKKAMEIQLDQVMEACMSSLKEFRQELGDRDTNITHANNLIKKLSSAVEESVHTSTFNEKFSRLEEVISKLHRERESMKQDSKAAIERLRVELDSKLKTQKEEILAIPSEVPHLKKLMDQKLELVELNGQNAVLRSSNNERQIMLVERKIENIYQLVKQLDISKQEAR